MYKVISVSLFDLMFTKIQTSGRGMVRIRTSNNDFEYYKAVNDITRSMFYDICGKGESIGAYNEPHLIDSRFNWIQNTYVEFYINTESRIDLNGLELFCVKTKSNPSLKRVLYRKADFIGGNILHMLIDMIESLRAGEWAGYYWGCSISERISRESIKISGACTENTVKIYLDNSAWPYMDSDNGRHDLWKV